MVRRRNIAIIIILALMTAAALLFTNMGPAPQKFVEICYLERYPDVADKWVDNGLLAEDHYNKYGKDQNRIAGCEGIDYEKLRAKIDRGILEEQEQQKEQETAVKLIDEGQRASNGLNSAF